MANLTPSKTSFILHKDALYQDIQILSMEERGILLTAILEYQINGKIIEVDRVIQIALNHIIAQFTVDKNRYVDKCKKNQENAKKRWQQQSNATAKTDVPDDATVCDGIYYDAKHAYTDSVTEPYTDSVTEPYTDSVTEPYTDSVTEPYTDSVTEPYTDSVTKPYTDSDSVDRNHVFFSGFDDKTIDALQEWFSYQQQHFNLKIDGGYLKNFKPMILANIEAGNDIHYSVLATMSSRNKDGSRTKGLLYQPDPVKVAKEKNLSPEERKKQKEVQLKKTDRHNILSNYCNGLTYREAYTLLYRSKETFEHYPLRVTEVITKSECDRYKIKYPTRGEWLELNCEKEKFLLTNGNFLESDCK